MAREPLTPWQLLDAAGGQPHTVRTHDAVTRISVAWAAAELQHREPLCESPGWTWPVERAPAPPAWHGIVLAAALTAIVLGVTAWLDVRAERPAQARAAAAGQGAQVTQLASR